MTNRYNVEKISVNDLQEISGNGLYLMGSTHFNPITDEKFYMIKVGKSSDIKGRLYQHDVSNPLKFVIAIRPYPYAKQIFMHERVCHQKLAKIAIGARGNEWYRLSREDYLCICEHGFEWFKNPKNMNASRILEDWGE